MCLMAAFCTASAEQILPRDSVQRNCFKLALYTTRDADVGSLRSVRSQRRRRYREIIMLNNLLLAPHHHQVRRSHRSIYCWHGHAAAPYRASGFVQWPRKADIEAGC